MKIYTRHPRFEELSALRHIWETVFGSGADTFFYHYFDPEFCIVESLGDESVVTAENAPLAAGYLIPAGKLKIGSKSISCAMVFAVATLPEHRGKGYGKDVMRELVRTAREKGYPAVVLCPADDGLFQYYTENSDFKEFFYVSERKLKKPDTSTSSPQTKLTEITPDEYHELRKAFLVSTPHIDPEPDAFNYQELMCREYGGGLFKAESSGDISCAVVEQQPDGTIWIKELLSASKHEDGIIQAVMELFPSEEYIIRTPVDKGDSSTTKRFGMLSLTDEYTSFFPAHGVAPWYGLAFD